MKEMWIYDDEDRLVRNYLRRLTRLKAVTRNFVVKAMTSQQFEDEIDLLRRRQRQSKGEMPLGKSILDKASVFVIEYDLFGAPGGKGLLTGERVSYLARCFSKCEFIIGVNQFGVNSFDLTLRGHPESYADLNVGSEQLDNVGLWSDEKKGFRPWYWPVVPASVESFEQRAQDVREHIDEPISKVLALGDVMKAIPRSALQFLGKAPHECTFRDFVFRSGNGLKERDTNSGANVVASIAAARISKWLKRLVLPGQDILVDAPHLVYRYPSLLQGDREEIDTWNQTTPFDLTRSRSLDWRRISDFKFGKRHWVSRDTWYWRGLSSCQDIEEVSSPWEREEVDLRFCEDTSSFHREKDCAEFVIDSDSPYNRRFIRKKHFPGVDYVPAVNLLG